MFISLLFIIILFSSSFLSGAIGSPQSHITVYDEIELIEAISAAPDNEYYGINIGKDIALKKPLEIPRDKKIGLLGGRLVGSDGVDTIVVKSGGELQLWGVVVTHAEGDGGRGVYVECGGTYAYYSSFMMSDGGVIFGNIASNEGGGVYIHSYGGVFDLYDGMIYDIAT